MPAKRKKRRRWRLPSPAVFFAVSAVLLLLSLGITMYYDITRQRKEVDSTISGTAAYIASMPQVADMLQMGYPSESLRRDLDSLCRNTANLNVVLICDKNGLRFYHTDRNTTGETVTDGDEAAVLAGSPPYITTGYGSLGTQRRAFHSIQDDSGSIIGYVMASVFTAHLSDSQKRIVTLYLTVLAFMLLVSLLLSRGVVVLLQGRLMGHEPEELLDIYIRQDAVLGSLEEGLIAADPSGRVLFANQAASDLFCGSRTSGSLEGKQLSALFPDTDFSRLLSDDDSRSGAEASRELKKQPVQKIMSSGTDAEKAQESRVLADSFKTASVSGLISNVGSRTLLIKTIPIIRKDSMKGVLMVLNDRTEVLRMSDELSGTRATLDTLRAFNHEFMNKLHVILGYLQTGETKKAITFIMNSSLVSSQAVRETAERIRVSSICALIIGKMMHAAELGIRLSLSPDSICLEHDLLISSEEMITVVGNLLENAVEELADPDNADRAIKEIKLSLFCRRDFNLIVCEDTGRGICRELAERICDKGVSTKGESRGLGLFLIKDIAERRRGELYYRNRGGRGNSDYPHLHAKGERNMYSVIIVEDDPMVASINRQYVELEPFFSVKQIFKSGQDALSWLSREEVDLIILDYYMPLMTGQEFIDRLHSMGKAPSVIMVTSAGDSAIVQELLSRGVLDYLVKPFERSRFRQALSRFAQTRSCLDGSPELNQAEIDRLLSHAQPASPSCQTELAKGLSETTLTLIRNFLKSRPGELFSSEQIAEQVHLSRITIRRYMNYMLEIGEIVSSVDYQTGGRPSIKYTCSGHVL